MRWRYDDPPLVWLLVASYVAHVLEEFLGRFPDWLRTTIGRPLPMPAFIVINIVGFAVFVASAFVATKRTAMAWLAIALATLFVVNALVHLLGTVATGAYSPGLITGMVLYLPLGLLLLLRAWDQAPPAFIRRGIVWGLLAQAAVFLAAVAAAYL